MPIVLTEKIVQGSLAAGLELLKSDLNKFLPDIFDQNVMGEKYLQTVNTFLSGNKIKIVQGYPMEDTSETGWYVISGNNGTDDTYIGDYVKTEIDSVDDPETPAHEFLSVQSKNNVRVITAGANADVVVFMDAIVRYILFAAMEDMGEMGLHNISFTTTELDPLYQFLPQNRLYKTTTITCNVFDTWVERAPLIARIQAYMSFHDTELYTHIVEV